MAWIPGVFIIMRNRHRGPYYSYLGCKDWLLIILVCVGIPTTLVGIVVLVDYLLK